MPRSELGPLPSRASGSSNDEERMSSLLRQHYLLRAFNSGNNSREPFVTPATAKVFRSFLAPRDDNLYCLFVVCWLYTKQRRTSLTEKTKLAQVSCKASLLVEPFISPYYLLAVFPCKCTDNLLLCPVYLVTFFFLFVWRMCRTIFFPSRMVFFLPYFG